MKKIISLLLVVVMCLGLVACGGETTPETTQAAAAPATEAATEAAAPAEVEKITLTVWGPQEDQVDGTGWLQQMCQAFAEKYADKYEITFEYGVCAEGDAKGKVVADVAAAADVYMMACDQIGDLVASDAIAPLPSGISDTIKANNNDTIINSVTYTDGQMYAVPFTNNTWFMYYDTSVFTEEDIKSLDAMLEKGKVAFPITTAWYVPSFYCANGGTMFGEAGIDGAAGIDFYGDNGTAVTDYIIDLFANPNFMDDANGVGMNALKEGTVSALFSGSWDAANVREALGDNFGAAACPSITINGELKQLQPFGASKAIAVNPQSKNLTAAYLLAAFLGSDEAQLAHYEIRGIIPCSKNLAEAVADDPVASAELANMAIATVQPSIPEMGSFWTPGVNLTTAIKNGDVTHDNAAEMTQAWVDALNGK